MSKISYNKNDADSPGAASSTLNINTTSETQQHNTEQRINNLEQNWKVAKETHDELNRQNPELLKERIKVAEEKHDIIDEQHTIIVKHGRKRGGPSQSDTCFFDSRDSSPSLRNNNFLSVSL